MKKTSELNIAEIEKKIGYTFKDKSLLTQAFTRTSFCNEVNLSSKTKYHSNEVLEFFGDGVLSLSIISFLLRECTERYEHGIRTELGEGDFSNIKSKLSDKQNLSKSMKALGLEKHLLMGEGDLKLGIQNEPSVMEDLFESIVGAIFIDSDMNMQSVIKAVSGMLDMSVYTDRQKISQSAKNALQEWCADKKRRLPAPRYETLSEDGPDHKKTYMRGCYIGDKLMGRGIGKNFKLADAAAAEDALKALTAQNEQDMQTKIDKTAQKSQAGAKDKKETVATNSAKTTVESATANNVTAPKEKMVASYATLLKNYATSNKKSSPVFRDLGERRNGKRTECAVECSFMDAVATGVGPSRPEAREAACKLIAEKLGIGKRKAQRKPASPAPDVKKAEAPAPKIQAAKAKNPTAAKAKSQKKRPAKKTKKPAAKV
ncbi:MAG: hypothetical protein IJW53_04800 [Clostridia bacterium]|nr:hypothetical protein [Clostridia bacterium]